VIDFCLALDAGFPIALGIFADAAFDAYDGTTPVSTPDLNDPNGGGHYVYAIGYRTDSKGKRILRVRNSWGYNWGLRGDFEGDENFIACTSDAYVISVHQDA
jgi:C1A family cysteine protease